MLDTLNGAYMGKGKFLPGLKKFARKATTAIAKTFLPSSVVDAAANFDPTKKKALANAKKSATELLQPTAQPKKIVKPKAKLPVAYIGIGLAAVGALLLIGKRR
jgi:hypothetical protein